MPTIPIRDMKFYYVQLHESVGKHPNNSPVLKSISKPNIHLANVPLKIFEYSSAGKNSNISLISSKNSTFIVKGLINSTIQGLYNLIPLAIIGICLPH